MNQTSSQVDSFKQEVRTGQRYRFGRNWKSYARNVSEDQVLNAQRCLAEFLEADGTSPEGKSFIDIGSGSGLHSLAAHRLGAGPIFSFDYDPDSVATTESLKARFTSDAVDWHVEQGSILDLSYIESLGQFDIVYSWGVLHHTGQMWQAFENIQHLMKPGGLLFIAIYNDQGERSLRWLEIKRRYCSLLPFLRPLYALYIYGPKEIKRLVKAVRKGHWEKYKQRWSGYERERGMSRFYDLFDWLGGYPYEYATVEALTDFFEKAGYETVKVVPNRGLGCHEILFRHLAK